MSLRDVAFALARETNESDLRPWSLRACVGAGIWPALEAPANGKISVRELLRRFAAAGRELRVLAGETQNPWTHISRSEVVDEIRRRLRDPAIMRQNPTDYCGAYSILVEFARRNPARFVKRAAELLRTGSMTTRTGKTLGTSSQLRDAPLPKSMRVSDSGGFEDFETPAMVEWMFASTMRQGEAITDLTGMPADFDGQGLEGLTLPSAVKWWTAEILGLKADLITCWSTGELEALRQGQRAIDQGGIAILLIDKNLLKKGDAEDPEEHVRWIRRKHSSGGTIGEYSKRVNSKDDDYPPDHYVIMLGGLRGAHSDAADFRVNLWSYGCEYEVIGDADGFGEYLYWVITGVPKED